MNSFKSLIAVLLVGALWFPTSMQWVHLSEGHAEEKQCSENQIHFHESEPSCFLTSSFVLPFHHTAFFWKPNLPSEHKETIIPAYESVVLSQKKQSHFLRGPPVFIVI